ncbi:LOW QUALITY PROTEIN: uncharacterized protein EMH_0042900 [Eimeria mitis]|uniref:Uncharacterized protein n=1 Tax=Eimeria mitis TaxID=44415 RepID=U6K388_9EIME|nr:LOW QUALITY PROTEIN: uncharacterized protein EMH_0042900 [Eimeria mitis]CDJ32195.1 hypothetical protein, conserved [Eimeria mitis]
MTSLPGCSVSSSERPVVIRTADGNSNGIRGGSSSHANRNSIGSSHRKGNSSGNLQPRRHARAKRGSQRICSSVASSGRDGGRGGASGNGDASSIRKMRSNTLPLGRAIRLVELRQREIRSALQTIPNEIEHVAVVVSRQEGESAGAAEGMPAPAKSEISADVAVPRSFSIRLRSSCTSHNAAERSEGVPLNTSTTTSCRELRIAAESANRQHAAKGLRRRRGCASAATGLLETEPLDDPATVAAVVAEEQRLLAAAIAAEPTRGPPRELVACRVIHGNHKGWDSSLSYAEKIRHLVDGGFVRRSLLQKVPPSTASICGQFGIPNHVAMLEDRDRVKFYTDAIRWHGPAPPQRQQVLPLRREEPSFKQQGPLPQVTMPQELPQQHSELMGRSQVYGRRVLEIGCGPLALFSLLALQQGAAQVDALELNPGVYQFASTFVQQIGVNAPPLQQYDLERPQKPKLRVFRCYSKLFPLASWRSIAVSGFKTSCATSPPPLRADAAAAAPVAAVGASLVVLLRGSKGEGAAAATSETAASVASAAEDAVMGGSAVAGQAATSRAARDTADCTATVSPSSLYPAAESAPPFPVAVADTRCNFDASSAAAAAPVAANVVEGAEFQFSSWTVGPRYCFKQRQSQRVADRLQALPRSKKRRFKKKHNSYCRRKGTGTSTCGVKSPSAHQVQQEGELYDMVLHEILGDFASQEGVADVIRDIQERTGTIPQSIPFAARTFVGVTELPSPCCIKCPASEHPERTVISPRERLLQSVGLRFSEALLSTQLKAIEELEFESRMDTQMLQRRTLLFEVEKDGLFAGLLAAIEVEIRPGVFFGPVYEGQCDSWYTNVVLLGKEVSVTKGDRILLQTEANLTNFQREQHMVCHMHSCSLTYVFPLSVVAEDVPTAVAEGFSIRITGKRKVTLHDPADTSHDEASESSACYCRVMNKGWPQVQSDNGLEA